MEKDDEIKGSGNSYTTEFRQYDPRLGRWLSVDPLAPDYPWQSPYVGLDNNPIFLTDPLGLGTDDWIQNEESGEYEWDSEVTGTKNTPEGYRYVGSEDSDVVKDLFGKTRYSTSDWDIGMIGSDDYENRYSSKGAAFYNIKTNTTMSVSLSADVETNYDNKGNIVDKTFRGVYAFVSVSGEVVAPYPDMKISLSKSLMTFGGNEMSNYAPPPNGAFLSGGDVPTLAFSGNLSAQALLSNKPRDLSFTFKGLYKNGNRSLSTVGVTGLLGVANYTNLSISVPIKR